MKPICVKVKKEFCELDELKIINEVKTQKIYLQSKEVSIVIKHNKAIDLANKIINSIQGEWEWE